MKRLTSILVLSYVTISSWGQAKEQKQSEKRIEFVFNSNLPDDLRDFYEQEKIKTIYKINRDLNPFYLRGDFDGDNKLDYALSIVAIKNNKKGIIIYHPKTKRFFVLGAGKMIPDGYRDDDMDWMDAWQVHPKQDVGLGVGETKKLTLKGEAILASKLESSSGLIYWDGMEYKWYQQGD